MILVFWFFYLLHWLDILINDSLSLISLFWIAWDWHFDFIIAWIDILILFACIWSIFYFLIAWFLFLFLHVCFFKGRIFTRIRRVPNESWVAIFDKERLHAILFLWEGDHTFLEKGCGTYSRDDDLRLILGNRILRI